MSSPRRSTSPVSGRVSKSRQASLIRWLNNVLPASTLSVGTLPEACKTGVMLAKLLEIYGCVLQGVYRKPAAKKSCLHNLEQVLSAVWKRGVAAHLMPTAEELLSGQSSKLWLLINVIFELFALLEIRNQLKELSSWTNRILANYSRRLQVTSTNSPYNTLAEDLASGVVYGCLLHAFLSSISRVKLDISQLFADPQRPEEVMHNAAHVLSVAMAVDLPVCFSVEEFVEADPEFRLLQLMFFYKAFKDLKPISGSFSQFRNSRDINLNKSSQETPQALSTNSSISSHQPVKSAPHSFSELSKKSQSDKKKQEEFSISSDLGNRRLKVIEQLNSQQERRFMYIADLRRKQEIALETKPISEPMSHTEPQAKSPTSNYETLLCILMTPHLFSLKLNEEWIEVSACLVPNDSLYSLHSEAYFFEWRSLSSFDVVRAVDVFQITALKKDSPISFQFLEQQTLFQWTCKSSDECDQIVSGLGFVLQKVQRKPNKI